MMSERPNDPCSCGSGAKYKKCCRRKGNPTVAEVQRDAAESAERRRLERERRRPQHQPIAVQDEEGFETRILTRNSRLVYALGYLMDPEVLRAINGLGVSEDRDPRHGKRPMGLNYRG